MTGSGDRLQLLHGSSVPIAQMRTLRAGPVTLRLDGIDLRYLRIGQTELVRRVYAAVRDCEWDTVAATTSAYEVSEREAGFLVSFEAHHTGRDIDFSWRGTIAGDETGRVEFVFEGRAEHLCRYNRIGICVHHPWRETVGARYVAQAGEREIAGCFPDLIGPQALVDGSYRPLFPAFDRLELELPTGGKLLFEFEGDLWEVEDHRNWTDANFKTYSTPVSLGRPTPLQAGQVLRQRLVITPVDVQAAPAAPDGPVRLSVGAPTGTRVPPVGLGHDRDHHQLLPHETAILGLLSPAHLKVEVRLDSGVWRDALAAGQETAAAIGSLLEVSLHLVEADIGQLAAVASALRDGPSVERVLVINGDSRTGTRTETTRPQLVDAVRAALGRVLPETKFFGGTEVYFTELNRTRPELASWDGVCYSLTPQVHAFADVDVVENLDAQGETVRSAKAFAGEKAVAVSPISMRRRVNFHAAGVAPPDVPGELPDSVDVRQSALCGAAWTAASLKYLAEAGAASATYFEATGWRGVLERDGGSQLPETFRSVAGEAFPLYHPLADAIQWEGADVLACTSSDILVAVAFAVRQRAGRRLLVVNLTPVERDVVVSPVEGAVSMRRLNEVTAAVAGSDPAAYRGSFIPHDATGELNLTLAPYEVVRVDSV